MMSKVSKYTHWTAASHAWGKLKPLARKMRNDMPLSERKLWLRLSKRQLLGLKFRRQHAIDQYIVDSYCHELKLIIEVDGLSQENTKLYDSERQGILEGLGFCMIRVKSEDVVRNIDGVIFFLIYEIKKRFSNILEEGDPS